MIILGIICLKKRGFEICKITSYLPRFERQRLEILSRMIDTLLTTSQGFFKLSIKNLGRITTGVDDSVKGAGYNLFKHLNLLFVRAFLLLEGL